MDRAINGQWRHTLCIQWREYVRLALDGCRLAVVLRQHEDEGADGKEEGRQCRAGVVLPLRSRVWEGFPLQGLASLVQSLERRDTLGAAAHPHLALLHYSPILRQCHCVTASPCPCLASLV